VIQYARNGVPAMSISGWQPTPPNIIADALRLAAVGPNDLVFDLGCGDGRVVALAAKRFGASAVGFEIDPVLLQRAHRRINRLGVAHLAQLRRRSILRIPELHQASVVYLFLPQAAVNRLRPVLLRDCRAGTRVVSVDSWIYGWPTQKELLVWTPRCSWRVGLWYV
jgi:protein-L-isoaspartate O-methyltransferase